MNRMEAMGDIIDAQLTMNGGGSMVDKVNRINPNHAEVTALISSNQETIMTHHEEAKERWVVISQTLEADDKRLTELQTGLATLNQESRAFADRVIDAGREAAKTTLDTAAALHQETLDVAKALKEDGAHE